jgi:hypothetical protein
MQARRQPGSREPLPLKLAGGGVADQPQQEESRGDKAMAAYNKINQFVEDLARKVHNLGADVLTIALTTMAAKPVATNTILANLTQVSFTNLTGNGGGTSGRAPPISSCVQTAGTLKLVLADLVLTASGPVAPFGAVVLFNDTSTAPNDPLICWWEYGSDVTLASAETFTLDFDNTNGVLQIA